MVVDKNFSLVDIDCIFTYCAEGIALQSRYRSYFIHRFDHRLHAHDSDTLVQCSFSIELIDIFTKINSVMIT